MNVFKNTLKLVAVILYYVRLINFVVLLELLLEYELPYCPVLAVTLAVIREIILFCAVVSVMHV